MGLSVTRRLPRVEEEGRIPRSAPEFDLARQVPIRSSTSCDLGIFGYGLCPWGLEPPPCPRGTCALTTRLVLGIAARRAEIEPLGLVPIALIAQIASAQGGQQHSPYDTRDQHAE